MASYSSSEYGKHDYNDHPKSSDCDPGALDDLKCQAEGIAKQAELMSKEAGKLDKRRKDYDDALKNYTRARGDAEPAVKELNKQALQLTHDLACKINDDRIIQCLKDAADAVQQRIRQCGSSSGCCIDDDCEFDTDVPTGDPASQLKELYSRQADVGRRTDKAEACFDELIKEPTNLANRVNTWRKELGQIATDAADPKTIDFKRLYARALVAKQAVHDIWRGFSDVNAYIDCLCRALMCSLKGRTALASLGACIAVLQCQERERGVRCTRLQSDTLEEILAEYLRICPPRPSDNDCESSSTA